MPLAVLNGNFLLTQRAASRSPAIHIAVLSRTVKSRGKGRLIGECWMLCERMYVCEFAVDVSRKRGSKAAEAFKIMQRYAALHCDGKKSQGYFVLSDVMDGHTNRFYTLLSTPLHKNELKKLVYS